MTDTEKEIEKVCGIIDRAVSVRNDCIFGVYDAAENVVNAGYRKADDLLDKIADLTGEVEALKKDNENLMLTLEEGREEEYEKPSMRENELHEPRIETESVYFAGVKNYSATAYCSACGLPIVSKMADSEAHARAYAIAALQNYCPHCGARLQEVKYETPKN